MTPLPEPDWLDDLLKAEPAYIDDDGFSQKIVAQLPQRARLAWRRRAILSLSAIPALVAGWLSLPTLDTIERWFHITPISFVISQNSILIVLGSISALAFSSALLWLSREH